MTRLLITRPQQDSESLAEKLGKYDIECVIEPMLAIVPELAAREAIRPLLDPAPQAIVVTSKHALEVFPDLAFIANIPTFASGARTAEYCREMGMKNVTVTGEKVSELADYIATHLKPEKEHIIYLSGADITTDLQDVLHDYKIERLVTYKAELTESFSPEAIKEISAEKLTGVVFFTQRSTAAFMQCIKKAGLEFNLKALRVYCLSDAVAETLSPTLFKSLSIAATPTVKSMVDLIVTKTKAKADNAPPVVNVELPVDKKTQKAKAEQAKAEKAKAESENMIAPARAKSGHGKWIAALLVTQLASTSYFAFQSPSVGTASHVGAIDSDSAERIKALESRLEKLEASYSDLAQNNKPKDAASDDAKPDNATTITPAEVESIHEQLGELTTRIAKAENSKINDARIKEMLQLKDQIEVMRSHIESDQKEKWHQIQLLSSYDALSKAIANGQAYTNPLFALRIAAEAMPETRDKIEVLTTYQDKGVATLKQLQAQFEQSVETYMQQPSSGQNGFWERIKRNLSKLIVIRKVGETHVGTDNQSRIARAEAALVKDLLPTAIEEIEALSEPASGAFADWLAAAKAHIQVNDASNALYHDVVMTIGSEKK